jgi:hypothetical protein
MGYDASTLAQTRVLHVTPNGNEGAIWGAGAAAMAADGNGDIFLLDANGDFDTNLNSAGFPRDGDFGNAFLELSTQGGLAVADYFEMDDEQQENDSDWGRQQIHHRDDCQRQSLCGHNQRCRCIRIVIAAPAGALPQERVKSARDGKGTTIARRAASRAAPSGNRPCAAPKVSNLRGPTLIRYKHRELPRKECLFLFHRCGP